LWVHHSWINISLKPQNGKEIFACVNNFVVKLRVLKCYSKRCKSRDDIFDIVNSLPLERSWIRIPARKRDIFLLHIVQTVFGVHPTSYTVDTRSLLWVKRSGREGDKLPSFSAEVKN
jgi:hypothetical protein